MHNLLMTLFHNQPIHGRSPHKLTDLVIPQPERTKSEQEDDILRWEDDGGKIMEVIRSALDQKRRNPNE